MHHGPELSSVLIAALALVLGAILRLVSRWTGFPYTIAVLVAGLLVGLGLEQTHAEHGPLALMAHGQHASPDLIIFVFLPALVFESAYSIDVHEFRKNLGPVFLYAVPSLIIATLATAAAMVGITGSTWQWDWKAALVFGALISATDPVAVVAILRELGVSKRLAVLIEGESLMNDGTAIVVFGVLIAMLTGEVTSFDTGSAVLGFVKTVTGGALVGVVLAFIISSWMGRLFNDPLSEITLTLVLAYSAMIIAEGMLHVSGVIAVVVCGLWMSSKGKTAVSPEVSHFLHRFWEMLGYIANTLIFFLVGLLVAPTLQEATLADFATIGVAYLAIMGIRSVLTFGSQPVADRIGDTVSMKDAAIIVWGGLRGAVSLALALIVSQKAEIPEELRKQILLVTAGVVLLTIVVNGTTIGKLLDRLGFSKKPLAEQLAMLNARSNALNEVKSAVDRLQHSKALRTVMWEDVERELDKRVVELRQDMSKTAGELREAPEIERVAGRFRRALAVERQSYWTAFAEGLLSGRAAELLSSEIDLQKDRLAAGKLSPPETRVPDNLLPAWRRWLGQSRLGFDEVALLYDLSRAESSAAEAVLATLANDEDDPETCNKLRKTYQGYLMAGKERIEDLRNNLPEMATAVETRLAQRIQLNLEREAIEHLAHNGALSHAQAELEQGIIEERMHELLRAPERVDIPETADLVAGTPLFQGLNEAQLKDLADLTEEMVVPAGEVLFEQGDKADAMYVIARGAVHVLVNIDGKQELVDVLGGGDIIGEIALMVGGERTATVRAATALTLGRIARDAFQHLMSTQPTLKESVWSAVLRRSFDNAVRQEERFSELDHEERLEWVQAGTERSLEPGETYQLQQGQSFVFVACGSLHSEGRALQSGCLVELAPGATVTAQEGNTLIAALPHPGQVAFAPRTHDMTAA